MGVDKSHQAAQQQNTAVPPLWWSAQLESMQDATARPIWWKRPRTVKICLSGFMMIFILVWVILFAFNRVNNNRFRLA